MNRNKFTNRRIFFYLLILSSSLILLVKLFFLQIIDNSYKLSAEKNVVKQEIIYPKRGYIYDRNKILLAGNQRAYDLMVIPREIGNIDTLKFCQIIDLKIENFEKKIQKSKKYSSFKESIFLKEISKRKAAKFQEYLYEFSGFFLKERTMRKYTENSCSHILGYVSQVPDYIIKSNKYYDYNDNFGITGVERSYEKDLRGNKGIEFFFRDVWNRKMGSYKNGKYDSLAINGKNLDLTIDIYLQKYGELLMQNKKGSIVAIEPSTGEILTLISSPNYDPNLLVGQNRSENYIKLFKNKNKPLFDRSLLAEYPPGSTFKLINALIGLQEGVISPGTKFPCDNGWEYSKDLKVGCHKHRSNLNLKEAIAQSCNSYFCHTFGKIISKFKNTNIGYNKWRDHVLSFGLGDYLNNDLYTGKPGKIPTQSFYDIQYGRNRWKYPTIISISIGQDALLLSPIQLANMTSVIANRGYFYTPHIVKKINDKEINNEFLIAKFSSIDKKYFQPIINGMENVISSKFGTANNAKIKGMQICGKTGTAQNPHGKDHSIFIAFSPKNDPKIAIAVIVENSGWGSTWAAPIGTLMIEKYLTGEVSNSKLENFIKNGIIIDDRHEK